MKYCHKQAGGAQDGEAVSAIGGRSYNALTEHLLSLAGSATLATAASDRAPEAAAVPAEPPAATGSSPAAAAKEGDSHGAATMQREGEEAATGGSPAVDTHGLASAQGAGGEAAFPAATGSSSTVAAAAEEAVCHGAESAREGEGAVSLAASPAVAADAGTGGRQSHAEPDEAAELLAALHLSLSGEEAAPASQAEHPCQKSAPGEAMQAAEACGQARSADEACSANNAAQQHSPAHGEPEPDKLDQANVKKVAHPLEDGYVVVGRGSEEGTQPAAEPPCAQAASTDEETPPNDGEAPGAQAPCEAGKPAAVDLPALDWTAVAIPPGSHAAQPTTSCPPLQMDVQEQPISKASSQPAAEASTGAAEAGAGGTVREADGPSVQQASSAAQLAAESGGAHPTARSGSDTAEAQPPCQEQGGGDGRAGGGHGAGGAPGEGGRERREADARVIRAWLDGTSSQLTEHGLVCLHQVGRVKG